MQGVRRGPARGAFKLGGVDITNKKCSIPRSRVWKKLGDSESWELEHFHIIHHLLSVSQVALNSSKLWMVSPLNPHRRSMARMRLRCPCQYLHLVFLFSTKWIHFSNPQCLMQWGKEDYNFNKLWLSCLLNFSPYLQHFTCRHHISAIHWQDQFPLATILLQYFLGICIFLPLC